MRACIRQKSLVGAFLGGRCAFVGRWAGNYRALRNAREMAQKRRCPAGHVRARRVTKYAQYDLVRCSEAGPGVALYQALARAAPSSPGPLLVECVEHSGPAIRLTAKAVGGYIQDIDATKSACICDSSQKALHLLTVV